MWKKCLLIAFASCLSISISLASPTNLPSLGGGGTSMTLEQERVIGNSIMRQIRASFPLDYDPLTTDYIQSLGNRLKSASHTPSGGFRFFVVNDNTINAFALPGGNIGVHTGLITTAQSEDELAGVLAHEIAHVTQRHIARMVDRGRQSTAPTIAAIVASILLATASPELGQGALAATLGAATQMSINFTRSNEEEADRIGIGILSNAGLDPRAMPLFFERMLQANRYNEFNYPEFLRTHPVTENRIADARARAEQYPAKRYSDNLMFHLITQRIAVTQENNPEINQSRFEQAFKTSRALVNLLSSASLIAISS